MEKNNKKENQKNNFRFLIVVAAALIFACLINAFCFTNTRVIGGSMEPFLKGNDWIITDRLIYLRSAPSFGDVVVIRKPDVFDQPIVKRVIGTPSDCIEIKAGRLFRNGRAVENDFGSMEKSEDMKKIAVPPDCYFLMGDNRKVSNDSRRWKHPFVRREEIMGKAVLKYFPEFVILR